MGILTGVMLNLQTITICNQLENTMELGWSTEKLQQTINDKTSKTFSLKFKIRYAHSPLHLLFTWELLAHRMNLVTDIEKN